MRNGFGLVLAFFPFRLLTSGTNIFQEIYTSSIVIGQLEIEFIINNALEFCILAF